MIKVFKNFLNSFIGNQAANINQELVISYEEKRNAIEEVRLQFMPEYLIETGTFLGDTTDHFKEKFKKIFSVELSESLAIRAKERFRNNSNIKIMHGNSEHLLPEILKALDKPALCWLDGHYSSEFFLNGEYFITARADKNTPVENELDNLLSSEFSHIILVDDARLFNGSKDYPDLENVKQKVSDSKKKYSVFVKEDIIHILPVY